MHMLGNDDPGGHAGEPPRPEGDQVRMRFGRQQGCGPFPLQIAGEISQIACRPRRPQRKGERPQQHCAGPGIDRQSPETTQPAGIGPKPDDVDRRGCANRRRVGAPANEQIDPMASIGQTSGKDTQHALHPAEFLGIGKQREAG